MLSSFISRKVNRLSVSYLKFGNLLLFLPGGHWKIKWFMKRLAFTSLPLKRVGGIMGIFYVFKNLLIIDEYNFGAAPELSYLAFVLVLYLCSTSVIKGTLMQIWKSPCMFVFI